MQNQYDEVEIDLKDLLFHLLYRWRLLLLVALAGMLLAGGVKYVKSSGASSADEVIDETVLTYEEEIERYEHEKVSLEEAIANLDTSIEEQNQYIASAPLMKLNPYNIPQVSANVLVQYENMGDSNKLANLVNVYQNILTTGSYLEKQAEEMGTEARYLRELVGVGVISSATNDTTGIIIVDDAANNAYQKTLQITVNGTTIEKANEQMDGVLAEMENLHRDLSEKMGEHTLTILTRDETEVVDVGILDRQQKVRNYVATLDKSKTTFKDSLKNLSKPSKADVVTDRASASKKDLVKYALIGFIGGGFIIVCFLSMLYILDGKVRSEEDLKSRFKVKDLGVFSKQPKKKAFDFIDQWLRHLAGDDVYWADEDVYQMIVTNVRNYAGEKKRILVTGMASEEHLKRISDRLSKELPEIEIKTGANLIMNPVTRDQLAKCEGLILVEEKGVSKYTQIAQELELAANVAVEPVGVVLY